jgi:hypothetical protein
MITRPLSVSFIFWILGSLVFVSSGCMTVRTEHRIEPIHITLDVNLKVQRELDDFFGDLDAASTARSLQ